MAAILKILSALAAIIPSLLDWWQRRQAAKAQAETEARVADIRSDPANAWMRKFNEQANPDSTANKAGPDQPAKHP